MNGMLSIAAHFINISSSSTSKYSLRKKNIPFGIFLWRKVLLHTCVQQLVHTELWGSKKWSESKLNRKKWKSKMKRNAKEKRKQEKKKKVKWIQKWWKSDPWPSCNPQGSKFEPFLSISLWAKNQSLHYKPSKSPHWVHANYVRLDPFWVRRQPCEVQPHHIM